MGLNMSKKISESYKFGLVTVAMGFRDEEDIRKNGLYIFTKDEEKNLIEYVTSLFNKNESVLALKIKQTGYRSEHINIKSNVDLDNFIKNIANIFEEDNEIWIVSSSVIECWRCRIYLSNNDFNDTIEMAYSYDDHILDHIGFDLDVPYICYKWRKNNFEISNTNLTEENIKVPNAIICDILSKYSRKLQEIKKDLDFIGIDGISLDLRVNDGYDFHDFDVKYGNEKKVIDYYLPQLNAVKKLRINRHLSGL